MSSDTNWPNPERPGVPLFPERDGAHAIEVPGLEGTDLVYYWHQNGGGWTEYNYQNSDDFLEDEDTSGWIYKGPVLAPTQINEMMAAERQWCADACRAMSFDSHYTKTQRDALEEAENSIRNLGAAP